MHGYKKIKNICQFRREIKEAEVYKTLDKWRKPSKLLEMNDKSWNQELLLMYLCIILCW